MTLAANIAAVRRSDPPRRKRTFVQRRAVPVSRRFTSDVRLVKPFRNGILQRAKAQICVRRRVVAKGTGFATLSFATAVDPKLTHSADILASTKMLVRNIALRPFKFIYRDDIQKKRALMLMVAIFHVRAIKHTKQHS